MEIRTNKRMSDLISRQAAIEAVEHITSSMSVCVNTNECHGMKRMQRQVVIELANLPSAQPEIVRCEECAYRRSCMLQHFVESNAVDGAKIDWSDWYCASGERREE